MAQKGDSQMDIQTLKYFLCIVDCQGITAAARKLNMTQPPLSNQLKALERELGFPLFVREKKKFILTAEGQILYQYAKNLSSEFDEMTEIFENMREIVKGTTLIISHQERILEIADEIILMKNGQIEKIETSEEFMKNNVSKICCKIKNNKE